MAKRKIKTGEQFRRARRALKLSQRGLADLLGMKDERRISRLENAQTTFDPLAGRVMEALLQGWRP